VGGGVRRCSRAHHGAEEATVTGCYTWRSADVAARLGINRSTVSRKARKGEIPGAALVLGQVRFDPAVTGAWVASVVTPIVPAGERVDAADVPFRELVSAAEQRLARGGRP